MLSKLRDSKLAYYDIQITWTLNPLNWEVSYFKYDFNLRHVEFGPIRVLIYSGV